MEGFKRGEGQKLILVFMYAGIKRNLSWGQGQTLPRNPSDGKHYARMNGLYNEICLSNMQPAQLRTMTVLIFATKYEYWHWSEHQWEHWWLGIYLYQMHWGELSVQREHNEMLFGAFWTSVQYLERFTVSLFFIMTGMSPSVAVWFIQMFLIDSDVSGSLAQKNKINQASHGTCLH